MADDSLDNDLTHEQLPVWDLDAEAAAIDAAPQDSSTPPINLDDPTLVLQANRGPQGDSSHLQTTDLRNEYGRYRDFRVIGSGGIGSVHSCDDPHLGRRVAIKSLLPKYRDNREQRTRFVREARVMAQLEHPNIMPVHELGVDVRGCVYFAMKRVKGATLREILNGLIRGDKGYVRRYPRGELLEIFSHVCQAIAFAHSRGVIHRDLKPENVMIGDYGEVLVLDWGLAKILGEDQDEPIDSGSHLEQILDLDTGTTTVDGEVAGTPVYMAPEQARGKVSEVDQRTDLYSLGVILYEMLTRERPIAGASVREILRDVVAGKIVPPARLAPEMKIPHDLNAICMKALANSKEDRYPSVQDFLDDINRYIQGRPITAAREPVVIRFWKWCRRHAVLSSAAVAFALAVVLSTSAWFTVRHVRLKTMIAEGEVHRRAGDRLYREKLEAYAELERLREQETTKDESAAEQAQSARVEKLHSQSENEYEVAMVFFTSVAQRDPYSGPARSAINAIVGNRMRYAERTRDFQRLQDLLDFSKPFLGMHYERAAPPVRTELLRMEDVVRGDGSVTIDSVPPGAEVTVQRLATDAEPTLALPPGTVWGKTPLPPRRLAKGSYLALLRLPDHSEVRAPFMIDHAEKDSLEVVIPKEIPEGMVYVPAGKFYVGGIHARFLRLHQMDLPGFFIREKEVSVAEYRKFWFDPDGGKRLDEYMSYIRYSVERRSFDPAWELETGSLLGPVQEFHPVVGITQEAAVKYCEWLSRRTGRQVRLPSAHEWEKAARGVDGREFVWGNTYRPEYALTADNKEKKSILPFWAPGGSCETDRSIYGALDMAGNVREWTTTRFPGDDNPFYQVKGASLSTTQRFVYCAYASDTSVVPSDIGFRYVMDLE